MLDVKTIKLLQDKIFFFFFEKKMLIENIIVTWDLAWQKQVNTKFTKLYKMKNYKICSVFQSQEAMNNE